MHDFDTIAAISTPLGEGGIGIVRLSGNQAIAIAEKLFSSPKEKRLLQVRSHRILFGYIINPATGDHIDEVLLSLMRAPKTYTREDMVEINCHGGNLPLRRVLELVIREGARLAEPGEFTKRAFLNGRIDLSQAEAVLDVIRSRSEEAERIALAHLKGALSEKVKASLDELTGICALIEAHIDFPEEDIAIDAEREISEKLFRLREELFSLSKSYEEGKFFREGLKTAIVGRPNVGKSSLLNALLGEERAIVTEIPGTTRDIISEYINLGGYALRIMDTAGLREVNEKAEKEGVKKTLSAIDAADLIICVLDGSMPLQSEDLKLLARIKDKRQVIAANKADLQNAWNELPNEFSRNSFIRISAKTGSGIPELKNSIQALFGNNSGGESCGYIITNLRHKLALDGAADALSKAIEEISIKAPLELVSINLRDALQSLGEISGTVSTEDILNRIFSQFCIGK